MQLKEFFIDVVRVLKNENLRFAVAGGLIASVYRQSERLTKDLDFLLLAATDTQKKAERIIKEFDLHPANIGLDFILPAMPWFTKALVRAEQNQIDFGIGDRVPALTVEDVVIAKLYAVKNNPQRFQDLDDLQSIFAANADMDLSYLIDGMKELGLSIPKELKTGAPRDLVKIREPKAR